MTRLAAALFIPTMLIAMAGIGHAGEMEDWCAKVSKASSIVICSDTELKNQVIQRNKLFADIQELYS